MRDIQSAIIVTPSDTLLLTDPTLAFMVTVAGTITVDFYHSGTGISLTVLAGVVYHFRVSKIHATGTTATGIVALY